MSVVVKNFSISVEYFIDEKWTSIQLTRLIGGFLYVPIPHNVIYRIILTSNHDTASDVILYIDNYCMGTWRLEANNSITLERPIHAAKLFTFVRENSDQAGLTGLVSGKEENGLIKAVFKPERKIQNVAFTSPYGNFTPYVKKPREFEFLQTDSIVRAPVKTPSPPSVTASATVTSSTNLFAATSSPKKAEFSSGGTVLGHTSKQQFNQIPAIVNYDSANQTEINLRLVVDEVTTREIESSEQRNINSFEKEGNDCGYSNIVPPRLML
jgi:hypothetical protein